MGVCSSREDEVRTNHAIKIPLKVANKISKSICRISYRINDDDKNGTGFFMLLNDTKCLFTNYHIIKKDLINKNINIELYNNHGRISIKLNQKYIKFFEDLDITIIELNNSSFSELIKDVEFLDYDSNYIKGYNQYKNIDIFILQYLRDDIEVASGKVIGILNNFEFTHSIDTDNCASGSPIILPIILKVIGIHKQGNIRKNINYGTFIGEIFKNNRLSGSKNIDNESVGGNIINNFKNEKENNNLNEKEFKLNNKTQINTINDNNFTLDTNLYSRQIMTLGIETMNKIVKMKILILGLRGLGIETAKNIILLGPKEVQIYDPEIVKINDLGSNFYLNEEDVGKKRRDEASISQLSELNSYVHVSMMKGDIFENIRKFNVVVITEMMNREKLELIDEICRENNIAFIYACSLGLSGFIFSDFGKEHTIFDDDGEECKPYFIKFIEKISKEGFVNFESYSELNLRDNDFVKFSEVKGISQLNDGKPRKIKKISRFSFKIIGEDFSKYPEYISGGIVERIKIPKIIYNRSLKERFNNFYDEKPIEPIDSSKSGRNELLFIIFLALHEYFSKNNSLPELNNKSQIEEIVKRTKELYDELKKKGNLIWLKN